MTDKLDQIENVLKLIRELEKIRSRGDAKTAMESLETKAADADADDVVMDRDVMFQVRRERRGKWIVTATNICEDGDTFEIEVDNCELAAVAMSEAVNHFMQDHWQEEKAAQKEKAASPVKPVPDTAQPDTRTDQEKFQDSIIQTKPELTTVH